MGGNERLRLFCSLRLPPDVLDELLRWQVALAPGSYRLVPRENLHITLAFLGSTPADSVGDVVAALRECARVVEPPAFRPVRYRETRSAGMVVLDDEGARAARLAADLGTRLERLGLYRRESRTWLPHVTVVRFRERPRLGPPLPGSGRFVSSGAAVNMSVLRPSGAQYSEIESVALGG